ncbi:flagellar export apparatus protein FliQ [Clostridia bacterium]|nr:flagellar export apparatus protein FliQ [Clostridia bacterium]
MTQGQVLDVAKETIYTIIITALPLLLVSLTIGLIVSIFQTMTSIQEQTLTFVPKVLCIFTGLMLIGNWMLGNMTGLMIKLWSDFIIYIR